MKGKFAIAVGAIALCASGLMAQTSMVGLGISLRPTTLFNDPEVSPPLASFTVPLNFRMFRFEPEFGYGSKHTEEEDPFGGGTEEFDVSIAAIGTGAYFVFNRADSFLMYAGPRFGLMRVSSSFQIGTSPEESFKQSATFIGGALGGEHFFSRHFSVGGEARLTRFSLGKPEFEPDGGPEPDMIDNNVTTDGLIFFRFWF